jgi:dihydrofolate reductase
MPSVGRGDGAQPHDEFGVLIFPVVLGQGERLFGDGTAPAGLTLVKARSFPTGETVHPAERGRP